MRKQQAPYEPINVEDTLARMKQYAREKDRRYRKLKKFHEKLFGPLREKLFGKGAEE